MAVPVSQAWTVATYVLKQKLAGTQAVSASADAGAAISLQLWRAQAAGRSSIRRIS